MYSTYTELRNLRDREIIPKTLDHKRLASFHDQIMGETVRLAIARTSLNYGPPPSPFCFFVMGSAGRHEQGIWSDQDHGIVFGDRSSASLDYFLKLGSEISAGLHQTGYPYCDGDVMASSPLWCKSISDWEEQCSAWITEASWESIRHLLIFMDGRPFFGEASIFSQVKTYALEQIHSKHLLIRLLENTLHIKKGVGILGQLLAETHGPHSGSLNLKERALFPYVNGIRLLAIKEKLTETSTVSRLRSLPEKTMPKKDRRLFEEQFQKLLEYRLSLADHTNYDSGHYVTIDKLNRKQKAELKEIIRDGAHLFQNVRRILEREASNENE